MNSFVKSFDKLECNFYSNNGTYYITRQQIGTALEYASPEPAIRTIHTRNADRLDSMCVTMKVTQQEGSRQVTRPITCYTLRGVMEICRLSRQPKADAFMDFVWDVMESLCRGESVIAAPDMSAALTPEAFNAKFDSILDQLNALRIVTTKMGMEMKRLTSTVPMGTIKSTNPIKKGEYVPDAEKPAMSPTKQAWYDDINRMMRNIELATGDKPQKQMALIYDTMKQRYNVNLDYMMESCRRKWRKSPGEKISMISVIASEQDTREMFHGILRAEHHNLFGDVKDPFAEKKQEIVVEVTAKETNKPDVGIEKPALSSRLRYPVEPYDKVEQIVVPIAVRLNDRSNFYMVTYRKIIRGMKNIHWDDITKIYLEHNKCHGKPSKHDLILADETLFKKFKKSAEDFSKRVF